jgi:nickel transport protein
MVKFILILTTAVAFTGRVHAHALGAECKLRADRVEVEAYYDDDTPAGDARVHVENAKKDIVVQGRTDGKGKWSFPRPEPGRYLVVIDAGAGHRTQLTMTIPASQSASTAPAPDGTKVSQGTQATTTISEGPSRKAFTSFPWLKIGIGVAVIGGLSLAFWTGRRIRPQKVSP